MVNSGMLGALRRHARAAVRAGHLGSFPAEGRVWILQPLQPLLFQLHVLQLVHILAQVARCSSFALA